MKKRKKLPSKILNWRLLVYPILLLIPLFGWIQCLPVVNFTISESNLFFNWTLVSIAASSFILYSLRGNIIKRAHLWVIFLTYILGHYIQFYTLVYWYFTGNKNIFLILSRINYSLNISSELIFNIYAISAKGLCGLAIAFFIIRLKIIPNLLGTPSKLTIQNLNKSVNNLNTHISLSRLPSANGTSSVRKSLINYATIVAVIGFILLVLTVTLKTGARIDSATGIGRVRLPFKLAGIIVYSNRLLIPSISFMLIYLSDIFQSRKAFMIATTSYFLHTFFFSLIATSRSPIIVALFSFMTISIFSQTLTRSRIVFFLSTFASLPIFFGVVTRLRFMRGVGEVGNILNISEAFSSISSGEQFIDPKYLFFLMTRINGADTLLNIESFKAKVGIEYLSNLLLENKFDFGSVYTDRILENNNFAFGASPGLTGALSMISSSSFLIVAGVVLHVLLWHFLFNWFSNMSLKTKPLALAQISIMAGFYTSAGTFNKIPSHLALVIGIIFLCERVLRIFIRRSAIYPVM